jgi:hypothetical protein
MKRDRNLMLFARLVLFVLLSLIVTLNVQGKSQTEPNREYRFLFGPPDEIEIIATAGASLNKVFQDIYYKELGPRLPKKIEIIGETIWAVYWTYFFTLWPHEFGHWARAQQVGGAFDFKGFGFPFPKAEMKLPLSLAPGEGTLTSIGGFEINNLMKRQTHIDFYHNKFAYADELVHAFIQEVQFPFYAFVIIPTDPNKSSTWADTRGDPVESTLSIYKDYTGRPAIREDGSVDPELIDYYRESVYLSLLWTLLDPMLYQSAKAFAVDKKKNYGLMKPWMLGNERNAWAYSTQFHPSPLGYELYFTNYLRLNGKLYTFYFKAGRPYKNIGIGIHIPGLVEKGGFTLEAASDFWNQDIYGSGVAVSLGIQYHLYKGLGLLLKGSWKDQGYLVGKRVEKSTMLLAGFNYQFKTP